MESLALKQPNSLKSIIAVYISSKRLLTRRKVLSNNVMTFL